MTTGGAGVAAALVLGCALARPVVAQVISIGPELLAPAEAFAVSTGLEEGALAVRVDIAEGYYLYRDRKRVRSVAGGASVGELPLPEGKLKVDEFFGEVETFRGELDFKAPVVIPEGAAGDQLFEVSVQGCADAGVCYPPHVTRFAFGPGGGVGTEVAFAGLARLEPVPAPVDNTDATVEALEGGSLPLILFLFFNAGLLLSFTPCVLPMVPIAVAVTTGGAKPGGARAFSLGATYVAGMAVVYTLIGVLVARSGSTILAGALQTPYVLVPLSLAFLALSAVMLFNLNMRLLPSGMSQRLGTMRWRQGTHPGALVAGGVSAVVVSPCVAVPLVGALLYIATTGDVLLGAGALLALSLGMGMLPLACAAGAGGLLPRTGPLSEAVRKLFALMMAALAVWVLGSLVPPAVKMVAYGLLGTVGAMVFAKAAFLPGVAKKVTAGLASAVLSAVAAVMLVGGLTGGTNELAPLSHLLGGGNEGLRFEVVTTEEGYRAALKEPGREGTFEYYYADWCVSCRELEGYTFADPEVVAAMEGRRLIKVDLTADDSDARRMLTMANLFGPPGIIVRDAEGLQQLRYVGYVDSEGLLRGMQGLSRGQS